MNLRTGEETFGYTAGDAYGSYFGIFESEPPEDDVDFLMAVFEVAKATSVADGIGELLDHIVENECAVSIGDNDWRWGEVEDVFERDWTKGG